MMPRRGKAVRDPRPGRRGLRAASADPLKRPSSHTMRKSGTDSPPGVIGAAVVKAARRSAHLTRRLLARQLNVCVGTVPSWENRAVPLFSVPYSQLQQLAQVLDRAGALVGKELPQLLLASRCDLLLAGMLNGFEDYAEVPPIDEDGPEADSARSLLRWALADQVPDPVSPARVTAATA
jgi:DNA-binding transcriptional regulator YiaG